MNYEEIVYEIVKAIPKGKVMTYGMVAKLAGIKNPRHIGRILHNNPDPKSIPCHRVVNFQGKLSGNFAFGGPGGQAEKLRQEGLEVKNNKIDLNKYLIVP